MGRRWAARKADLLWVRARGRLRGMLSIAERIFGNGLVGCSRDMSGVGRLKIEWGG